MQIFYKLLLLSCIVFSSFCGAQTIIYQDVFKGGVTGDGVLTTNYKDTFYFNIHIPVGSTIKKALLFGEFQTIQSFFEPKSINFNNSNFYINQNNVSSNNYNVLVDPSSGQFSDVYPISVDVTHLIDPVTQQYSLIPPQNNPLLLQEGSQLNGFYLLVLYESPTMETVCVNVVQNKQNAHFEYHFPVTNINPIDLSFPVGLAMRGGHICNNIFDGEYVYINNDSIGLVGGSEPNSPNFCSGGIGSFYYENKQLYGLGSDTPSSFMDSIDCIANIQSYITDPYSFDVDFKYQTPGLFYIGQHLTNQIHQLFIAYATPCDPFDVTVTPDTTTCFNSPLQLHATGGSRYEWQPATGLSCANCPDPVVSTDSSRFYTVRIWNNDTCSVVRSVKVNVNELPSFSSIQFTASECGESTGTLIAKSNQPVQYSIDGSVPKTSGIFNQLSSGLHTVSILDSNGCSRDSVIFIPEIISVNALFAANPPSGGAPLAVQFTNQSTNASNYEWFVDGVSQGSSFSNYLFDSTGVYTTTLVTWQNNPTCTDTFTVHIHVYDSLMVQVPNVFTPNQDGNNDLFGITTNIPVFIDFQIFNRWGNVMASGQNLKSQVGIPFTPIWNGEDAVDGTYFYQITVRSQIIGQNLEVKADGFVHLVSGK